MFDLRLCNAAIVRYSQLKFGNVYICGMDYKYFSPHCCKCNSFGCTATIRSGNACHGPHSDSLYSGSEHSHFNSPRLVKREAGFPNPRRALIDFEIISTPNIKYYIRRRSNLHAASIYFGIVLFCKHVYILIILYDDVIIVTTIVNGTRAFIFTIECYECYKHGQQFT